MEILVVNDGSPDDSEKIIKEYEKKYSHVKGLKKKNGGLSDARNYGIKYAKGDYLVFIDSDDYVENNMIELLYKSITKNKADISICEFNYAFSDGRIVRSYSNLDYTNDTLKKYLLTPPMAWLRMYRRELFTKREFKKGIYYEDLELTPKFVLDVKKISFVNEALYNYVIRDDSIMRQKKFNEKLYHIYDVLDSNYELLYEKYPDEVEYMYIIHLLRTASLRFLDYQEGRMELLKIKEIMHNKFPNWKKNIYLKKSGFKIKLICYLAFYRQVFLLKIIKRLTGK